MIRRCFYSFHYIPDSSRAGQVRNMGVIDGNVPVRDNDWEKVKRGGDAAIERWINQQMHGSSCTVVLVGANTAGRQWITREIVKSWDNHMGVVGIRIHGLRDLNQQLAPRGGNPFDHVTMGGTTTKMSSIVMCYDPVGSDSKARYAWIKKYLADAVEEAINIRKKN